MEKEQEVRTVLWSDGAFHSIPADEADRHSLEMGCPCKPEMNGYKGIEHKRLGGVS